MPVYTEHLHILFDCVAVAEGSIKVYRTVKLIRRVKVPEILINQSKRNSFCLSGFAGGIQFAPDYIYAGYV